MTFQEGDWVLWHGQMQIVVEVHDNGYIRLRNWNETRGSTFVVPTYQLINDQKPWSRRGIFLWEKINA